MRKQPISIEALEDLTHRLRVLGPQAYIDHIWHVREAEWLQAHGLTQIPRPSSAWRGLQINAAAKSACYAIGLALRGLGDNAAPNITPASQSASHVVSHAISQVISFPASASSS